MRILFVCTGNICRSPIAERLSVAAAAPMGIADFTATSAGVHAMIGHPIHELAADVLVRLGGDPTGFTARQLTPPIAFDADLVLTMTEVQRTAVLELAPRQFRKTFTLGQAALLASTYGPRSVADLAALRPRLPEHHPAEVADPIGLDLETFEAVGQQIAALLPPVLTLCR
ncbi:arsenate reductase/protein-tyrosine-phosphatase family protein [Mycolicibacterium aubagnense]|uniref:arsenate reductase/protein-tyrosine-phosphatase family protein n=1 Tax=Mycolicibacterium aubagnense TaxID=319707 RepID=UPI0010FCF75C|nr:protein-tyrosine-phosphatase [Mycolicibacterium aubagnense]TLH70249.1 protein-tyrosine-phosphatase [Mycolicibacterium aubagnense]WGI35695.1 protein-tyrosine-phosphatase [Mycolicibacterium aubagnense]